MGVSIETNDDYKSLEDLLSSLERIGTGTPIELKTKDSQEVIDGLNVVNTNMKKTEENVSGAVKTGLFDVKSTLYNKIDQIWQQIRIVPPRFGGSPAQQIEFFKGLAQGNIDVTSGMNLTSSQENVIKRVLGGGDPKKMLQEFLKGTAATGGLNLVTTDPSRSGTLMKYLYNLMGGSVKTTELERILSFLNPETKLKEMQFGVKGEYGLKNIQVAGKGGVFESEQANYLDLPGGYMQGKSISPAISDQRIEGFVNRFMAENITNGKTFAQLSDAAKSALVDKFKQDFEQKFKGVFDLQNILSSSFGFSGKFSRMMLEAGRSFDPNFLSGMKGSLRRTTDISMTVFEEEVGNIKSRDDMKRFMLNFMQDKRFTGQVGESAVDAVWNQFNRRKGAGGDIPLNVELKTLLDQAKYDAESGEYRLGSGASVLSASADKSIIKRKGADIEGLSNKEQQQFFSQTHPDLGVIDRITSESQVQMLQSMAEQFNEIGLKQSQTDPVIKQYLKNIESMLKRLMNTP